MKAASQVQHPARIYFVLGVLGIGVVALAWRALELQVLDREFLQTQGDARHVRVVPVAAHRGIITDRHGEPLAISTPLDSLWGNPQQLAEAPERWPELAAALGMSPERLHTLLTQRMGRSFVYLRRHMEPEAARQVLALGMPGVAAKREYRRYYPMGEVAAQLVGLTDIDDRGLEGLELTYDEWLAGVPGRKRVLKDRLGRVIENLESIAEPQPGRDLRLSLDRRLQYLAYRELKSAVQRHRAESGSLVLLDAQSGEVLALVNQPSYNPNDARQRGGVESRNRAVTDLFEPGSTIKPFTVVAALESGAVEPGSRIDTAPGLLRIGSNTIRDHRDYGVLDVTGILQKSSNVGATRLALEVAPDGIWRTLHRVGFGVGTQSGFPGEANGVLHHRPRWSDIERATLSYGYGLSVTPLQLAQAYTALASDGVLAPVRFVAGERGQLAPVPALAPDAARAVRAMLESAVRDGGTGTRAQVQGYRIAGKTGTVKKAEAGGYRDDSYIAVFAGMAPATRPRLVMVVVVDDPATDAFYGGEVAAPVFASVMAGALRLLNVPPDEPESYGRQLAHAGAAR